MRPIDMARTINGIRRGDRLRIRLEDGPTVTGIAQDNAHLDSLETGLGNTVREGYAVKAIYNPSNDTGSEDIRDVDAWQLGVNYTFNGWRPPELVGAYWDPDESEYTKTDGFTVDAVQVTVMARDDRVRDVLQR